MEKQFLTMDADVLVEVGGIYGDGNANVTHKQGIKVSVVDYDALPYNQKAQAENEALELRKVLLSPANAGKSANGGEQTNWQQELDRLSLLREKAIRYLGTSIPKQGELRLNDSVSYYNGDENMSWGYAVLLMDEGGGMCIASKFDEGDDEYFNPPLRVSDLETSVLVEVCELVQKAIGKGVGK